MDCARLSGNEFGSFGLPVELLDGQKVRWTPRKVLQARKQGTPQAFHGHVPEFVVCGCGSKPMVPFWLVGEFTTHLSLF